MIIPRKNLIFKDQIEAAKALYDILPVDDILRTKPLITVPSLASVLLVDELAKMLKLNYEFLFTEKIYSPLNKDCVIGMVSETEEIVYLEEVNYWFKSKIFELRNTTYSKWYGSKFKLNGRSNLHS